MIAHAVSPLLSTWRPSKLGLALLTLGLVATGALVATQVPSLGPAARMRRYLDAAIVCSGHHCDVDRSRVRALLERPSGLAAQARIVPSLRCGRPQGFRLYAIRPASLPARLGLRNGDTVLAIAGLRLDAPDQALASYHALRTATHLEVEIERQGRPITLRYDIHDR